MFLVGQLHSSRQLNLLVMQGMVIVLWEFHSFCGPSCPQLLSTFLESCYPFFSHTHKEGKYQRKILKSFLSQELSDLY